MEKLTQHFMSVGMDPRTAMILAWKTLGSQPHPDLQWTDDADPGDQAYARLTYEMQNAGPSMGAVAPAQKPIFDTQPAAPKLTGYSPNDLAAMQRYAEGSK